MGNFLIGPNFNLRPTANMSLTNITTAAGWKRNFIFTIDEDATITTLLFRQGVSSSYTGTLRVGLQTVSTTTGLPTGTWVGGASNYVDVTSWSASNDGLFVSVTPSSSMSLTRGTVYAFCLEVTSAGTGSLSVTTTYGGLNISLGFGYTTTEASTAIGDKTDNTGQSPWCIRSSTKTYGWPIQDITNLAVSQATTPDEVAMGFTMPSGAGSTYKLAGVRMMYSVGVSVNQTFDMVLYSGTTALQTATFNTAQMRGASAMRMFPLNFAQSTLSTLNTGQEYILSYKPTTSGGASINIPYITVPSSQDKNAFGELSQKYYSRTDGGSWTEDTTRLLVFELIFQDFTTASGISANPLGGFVG